jgi:hypothetical protein
MNLRGVMDSNGAGVWKTAALFLAGMVVTLGGAWITSNHDAVTRAEVPALLRTYTDEMIAIREQNARLEEKVNQLQVDVARISERLGVPAHPGRN